MKEIRVPTDMMSDPGVRVVVMKYGAEALSVYLYILMECGKSASRSNKMGTITLDVNAASFDLKMSAEKIWNAAKSLVRLGVLHEDEGSIYSRDIARQNGAAVAKADVAIRNLPAGHKAKGKVAITKLAQGLYKRYTAEIEELWEYYYDKVTEDTKKELDLGVKRNNDRIRNIGLRLKDGYTVEDLRLAVDGYKLAVNSYMSYIDIIYPFRESTVDKYIQSAKRGGKAAKKEWTEMEELPW